MNYSNHYDSSSSSTVKLVFYIVDYSVLLDQILKSFLFFKNIFQFAIEKLKICYGWRQKSCCTKKCNF